MEKKLQELIEKLTSLPVSEQLRFIQQWTAELESGDGAAKSPPRYEDIKHLAGSIKGAPADLSSNPNYLEDLGKRSMGPKKRIPLRDILGCYTDLPADLSTNPTYMEGFGE